MDQLDCHKTCMLNGLQKGVNEHSFPAAQTLGTTDCYEVDQPGEMVIRLQAQTPAIFWRGFVAMRFTPQVSRASPCKCAICLVKLGKFCTQNRQLFVSQDRD